MSSMDGYSNVPVNTMAVGVKFSSASLMTLSSRFRWFSFSMAGLVFRAFASRFAPSGIRRMIGWHMTSSDFPARIVTVRMPSISRP